MLPARTNLTSAIWLFDQLKATLVTPCFLFPGPNFPFFFTYFLYIEVSRPLTFLGIGFSMFQFVSVRSSLAFSDMDSPNLILSIYLGSHVLLLAHIESRIIPWTRDIDYLNLGQMLLFIFIAFHLVSFNQSFHPIEILSSACKLHP